MAHAMAHEPEHGGGVGDERVGVEVGAAVDGLERCLYDHHPPHDSQGPDDQVAHHRRDPGLAVVGPGYPCVQEAAEILLPFPRKVKSLALGRTATFTPVPGSRFEAQSEWQLP